MQAQPERRPQGADVEVALWSERQREPNVIQAHLVECACSWSGLLVTAMISLQAEIAARSMELHSRLFKMNASGAAIAGERMCFHFESSRFWARNWPELRLNLPDSF